MDSGIPEGSAYRRRWRHLFLRRRPEQLAAGEDADGPRAGAVAGVEDTAGPHDDDHLVPLLDEELDDPAGGRRRGHARRRRPHRRRERRIELHHRRQALRKPRRPELVEGGREEDEDGRWVPRGSPPGGRSPRSCPSRRR